MCRDSGCGRRDRVKGGSIFHLLRVCYYGRTHASRDPGIGVKRFQMADVIFIVLTAAVFALLGLMVKAVERL
jgi:hypothetical protein